MEDHIDQLTFLSFNAKGGSDKHIEEFNSEKIQSIFNKLKSKDLSPATTPRILKSGRVSKRWKLSSRFTKYGRGPQS